MKITYNKLVRDRIPEIIAEQGKQFATAVYDDTSYLNALKQKVIEEANEVARAASDAELIKEIGDLYEVLDALLLASEIAKDDVFSLQEKRRIERGGFEEKLELLWVEEDKIEIIYK